MKRRSSIAASIALFASFACGPQPRPAVSLKVTRDAGTPATASVYIDEQFVAPLGVVIARGVRLPEGEHRITIQRKGYFSWDQLVISDRQPVHLKVQMVKIPE